VNRTSRDRKKIERALRTTPSPAPPKELRARLLGLLPDDGLRAASARPVWGIAVACVVSLVAAAAWLGRPTTHPKRPREAVAFSTARPPGLVAPEQEAKRQVAAATPTTVVATKQRRQDIPHKPHTRLVAGTGIRRVAMSVPSPQMTVTVGRATPTTVGVASASSMLSDGAGGWTRTEWVMVRDPHSHVTRQNVSLYDGVGKRRKLTIASTSVQNKTENNYE